MPKRPRHGAFWIVGALLGQLTLRSLNRMKRWWLSLPSTAAGATSKAPEQSFVTNKTSSEPTIASSQQTTEDENVPAPVATSFPVEPSLVATTEPATTELATAELATTEVWGTLLLVRFVKGVVALVVLGGVALSLWPHPRAAAPPVVAPTLSTLNASLSLSEKFLLPLNHVFSATEGVTSEYYGVPVRLRFGTQPWMYPGQENVSVKQAYKAPQVERENIRFHNGSSWADVAMQVYWDSAHWDATRVAIEGRDGPPVKKCPKKGIRRDRCLQRTHRSGPNIVVYISLNTHLPRNQRVVATLGGRAISAGGQGCTRWFKFVFSRNNRAAFASWRYTIRHATANMREYARYHRQPVVANALGTTMKRAGLRLDQDIYAPLWGRGTQYGDNMPYWASSYHDCNANQVVIHGFYPYRSKVCRLPLAGYRWLSGTDTLLRALQAVHVMNRHHDPNYKYGDLDHRNLTPARTARALERTWQPAGIPQCTPVGCETQWVSAVRTAAFGTLETILGYQYGDAKARAWADNAALALLRVQIGPEGWMQVLRRRYYRPLDIGAFYAVWDANFHNNQDFPFLTRLARNKILNPLNMPAEFTGIIPSNTETTMAVYAFLSRYRCQRYGQGCGPDDIFGPAPNRVSPAAAAASANAPVTRPGLPAGTKLPDGVELPPNLPSEPSPLKTR